MRIVKELYRLAATVWLILLMAVIVDVMTETAEACGSADCVPTNTPEPTGTLVLTEEDDDDDPTRTLKPELTDMPDPTETEEPDDDDPTRTPKPTETKVASTSDPTAKPSKTPDPTIEPTAIPTERPTVEPHDCHVDGDGICPGEETPTPVIIFYTSTPLPPTPIPTLAPTERMVEIVPQAIACPITCCPTCDGYDVRVGVGSEVPDYSEVVLEFKPIAYILVGIFGANTLLRTYGTFRKD